MDHVAHTETESHRLTALAELELMNTPPEERFDRITRLAREIFDVPVAEINLLDADWQFTKSPQPEVSPVLSERSQSFCEITIQSPDMVVVGDATKDPRFSHKSVVTGERHIRFYAGRPLAVESGERVGTLCLVDTEPREFDSRQQHLLEEMAVWVERELQDNVERVVANSVPQLVLPANGEVAPGIVMAGASMPFHHVGGDFYDWTSHYDGRVTFTISDVMGKGVGAALLAATVRTTLAATAEAGLAASLALTNERLLGDFAATGSFATLFSAELDAATDTLRFVDAGHGLTIIVRADGSSERLSSRGFPLGVAPDTVWTEQTARVSAGDVVVSFTDGVLDLYDGTLESLDRFAELVRGSSSAAELVASVAELRATSAPTDDVSLVVLDRR